MINSVYLAQVKTPAESKGKWDYYKILKTMPGEQVYTTPEESTCPIWKQ
ncbi:ABC transporter substrate-binding protein [Castellaniella caeni]